MWSGILLWLWFAFPYYCHWASFHVPFGHLHMFFGEMSIKVFAYFLIGLLVFLLFSCKSSLHIVDTTTLSEKWFPNIFSCPVVCLFMLLIVFFCGKSVSFSWCLSTFSFIAYTFGVISKKSLPNPKSWSLCFLLRVL